MELQNKLKKKKIYYSKKQTNDKQSIVLDIQRFQKVRKKVQFIFSRPKSHIKDKPYVFKDPKQTPLCIYNVNCNNIAMVDPFSS